MGFVRKITGVQAQIDAQNANTNAQIEAGNAAAAAQAKALNASTQAAASAQEQAVARTKVEDAARQAASVPLAVADVALTDPASGSAVAASRKKRAQFGKNYSSGVGI